MPTFSMGGRAGGGRAQLGQHAPGTHLLVLGVHLLVEELAAHVDIPQLRQQVVELVLSCCWQELLLEAARQARLPVQHSRDGGRLPPRCAAVGWLCSLHTRLQRRVHLVGVAALRVGSDIGGAAVDVGADPVEAHAILQACMQGTQGKLNTYGHRVIPPWQSYAECTSAAQHAALRSTQP
jgi:hypothetical protein